MNMSWREYQAVATMVGLMSALVCFLGILEVFSLSFCAFARCFLISRLGTCQASAWHMICNWLGTIVYFFFSSNERAVITGSQWIPLILFSVVFSLNISVGNYSSMLVSVKFNQVSVRSVSVYHILVPYRPPLSLFQEDGHSSRLRCRH